jgi:SAM-dependent methyltransferase
MGAPNSGDARLFAPATQRNREPILAVLRRCLPARGTVLEVASGTGEHCAWFAAGLPQLVFQPSDPDAAQRASIAAWAAAAGVRNVLAPLALDVRQPGWEASAAIARPVAAVLCINMIHIAEWPATLGMMRGAAQLLDPGGVLYLYGPYRRGGRHTAPSNAAFDQSLRATNPAWGVRDLEAVVAAAAERGLTLVETVEMPANNLSVVFRREPHEGATTPPEGGSA